MTDEKILFAALKSAFPRRKFWAEQTDRWGRNTYMLTWVGGPSEEEVCDALAEISQRISFCCDRVEKA
jgi:hypothetical protein